MNRARTLDRAPTAARDCPADSPAPYQAPATRGPSWEGCCQTARDRGIAAALRELYAPLGPGVIPCGPGGHAVVPSDLATTGWRIWLDGTITERDPAAESVIEDCLLDGEGLAGLRHGPGGRAGPAAGGLDLLVGLGWLRLGLSERLLADCLAYLGRRASGDATLLDQQMIRGDLADAATEQAEIAATLAGATPASLGRRAIHRIHRQITGVDRTLLRLLGASGFLLAGPGRGAAVSELLADVFIQPDPRDQR